MPKYEGYIDKHGHIEVRSTISAEDVATGAAEVAGNIIGGGINLAGMLIGEMRQRHREQKYARAHQQLEWAMTTAEGGDVSSALDAVDRFIASYPNDPDGYLYRAGLQLLWSRSDPERQSQILAAAIADMNMALSLDSNDAALVAMRGGVYLEAGALANALADANRSVRLAPDNPNVYILRGRVFIALEDYDLALSDAQLALRIEADASVYALRGSVYKGMKDYQRALTDFSRAITLSGNIADLYEERAEIRQHLGEEEAAQLDLAVAARLRQDDELEDEDIELIDIDEQRVRVVYPVEEDEELPYLRCDGMYRYLGDGFGMWLKFYETGLVASVSMENTMPPPLKWFDQSHEEFEGMPKGRYVIRPLDITSIRFAIRDSDNEVVEYAGTIGVNALTLRSHNTGTGDSYDDVYEFVRLEMAE